MSHRSIATIRRPAGHEFVRDSSTPGCCFRCHLPPKNSVHSEQAIREQRRLELEAEAATTFIDPAAARELREELDGG